MCCDAVAFCLSDEMAECGGVDEAVPRFGGGYLVVVVVGADAGVEGCRS